MALELFKPFVYYRLEQKNLVSTVQKRQKDGRARSAGVWDTLDEVVREYRLCSTGRPPCIAWAYQAFEPNLIEGKAIQLHPLVCTLFKRRLRRRPDGRPCTALGGIANRSPRADAFVHNILSPANGSPIIVPSQRYRFGHPII